MPKTRLQQLEERVKAIQEVAVELISAQDNHSLLTMIVDHATQLTTADAAALYLRKDLQNLEFVIARNHSLDLSLKRQKLPIDGQSISAYVFRTQKTLNIADVHILSPQSPFQFDSNFDKKTGYYTKSILAVPLVTSKGDVLGVLQVLNKKKTNETQWNSEHIAHLEQMPPFSEEDQKLIEGFAALASASIEKTSLYEDIQSILEGFLHASVKVIDERDPTTRGHSERVAVLTRTLAEKCTGTVQGIHFNNAQMRELYYASLLHDFGKVGVREAVLLKPEKLFIEQLLTIKNRLLTHESKEQIDALKNFIHHLVVQGKAPGPLDEKHLEETLASIQAHFADLRKTVERLNQPTILSQDLTHKIETLRGTPYLEDSELTILSIPKGSLTLSEKKEIEDHVSKTYRFLKEIPWTKDFSQIAEIAYGHHEKLDGTGYPRRLTEGQIPVQSKMMAICDIYDALVASDRPYKAALPEEKALDILHMEAKGGKLDSTLLSVFVQARIFESIRTLLPQSPTATNTHSKTKKAA